MEAGSGGGGVSSETAVASSSCGEREGTTVVCHGGGTSACAADVGNEAGSGEVCGDGCDQAGMGSEKVSAPEVDPGYGARKAEKLVLHADVGVAPVASTSFKRSGGTGSSSSSRRTVQKRVVTIPIADVGDGSRARSSGSSGGGGGDAAPPPSDSWTWRKYGQKPIKGSPYPRGYYRCSSSKGCPARKQVERSRADPTMLIVTYAAEHNHPWPMPRNSSHHASRQSVAAAKAGLDGGAGPPPLPEPSMKPPPPQPSSSSTDEDEMEVEYENGAIVEDDEVEVKMKIQAEPEFTDGITTTTGATTMASPTGANTTTNAPVTTSSSPTSEETETFSADHSGAASDSSSTLMPPLVVDDICSTWFQSETEISLCSTADTPAMMLPFSYDELLADLGGRSGGGGYGVDEDEESLFAGLGELPEFSLVFRRG